MKRTKLLVHLHLYYDEQLEFMLDKLANINNCDWDLFVTVLENKSDLEERILKFKPDAKIITVENRGYDIWPFIQVIKRVNLDDYDYILKIHTKNYQKKLNLNGFKKSGFWWRNELINALLKNKKCFYDNLLRFENNSKLGFLCSKIMLWKISDFWPEDTNLLREELSRLSFKSKYNYYCAGTMFMAKAGIYKFLQSQNINSELFVTDMHTKSTGTLAHVYERIFTIAADENNYTIETVDNPYEYLKKDLTDKLKRCFNVTNCGRHRIFTLFGIKIKLKRKTYRTSPIEELEKEKIANSLLWDAAWYNKTYNYNFTRAEALNHFYYKGWKQGKSPSAHFNMKHCLPLFKDRNPLFVYFSGDYDAFYFYPNNCNSFKSENDYKKIEQYLNYAKTRRAKSVVYTCVTNDYDDIEEIRTYRYVNKDWDYVCFTDNEEHIKQGRVGIWHIRPLEYKELDNARNNRWHKTHPHVLFPEYEESIYIDANINILTNKLFELVSISDSDILLPRHFKNLCIYQEYEDIIRCKIDNLDDVNRTYELFKYDGMPRNYGFTENNVIYRKHNSEKIIDLMEEWWNIIKNYSKRDQLSFCYLLWKRNIEINDITFKNVRQDVENFYAFEHKGAQKCKS